MDVHYPDFGNTIAGGYYIITVVHSSCASTVEPLQLKWPPLVPPHPLGEFIWKPFNRKEHAIFLAWDDKDFAKQDTGLQTLTPAITSDGWAGILVKYHLHCPNTNALIILGSKVISIDGLCPVFTACPNPNILQHYFRIEFHHKDHSYVRAISSYKFVRCFGFIDKITYCLSHPTYKFALDAAMPSCTSAWLLKQIHLYISYLHDANSEIFLPNQFSAPAATIQAFVNGAIGVCLPSQERWIQAYSNDTEMSAIGNLVLNPTKINSSTLNAVNHNYRALLRQSQIGIEDGLLIYHEPMHGGSSYSCLQLVPLEFHNIIFIAFHSNAIGGHLNAYRTLHHICLRYYWPGMYSYITCMCNACPGCALANPTKSKSSKLVYNFPIKALFLVLFVDAYSARKHSSFDGFDTYLVACYGMTGFASMEPIQHANSKNFALAIMRTQLRYGFCHSIVLDKDSKFYSICREAFDLLRINCHVLSGWDNHIPMMVEGVNRYLTKGLTIMTNEQDSVCITLKAILLLLYAWNSHPILGMDIPWSFVAVCREFAFPIDYSTNS
jgi:hypothetical protein